MDNQAVMQPATTTIFQSYLLEVVYNELVQFLEQAEAGQCARLSTLLGPEMVRLCQDLRQSKVGQTADIFVLNETPQTEWEATSYKLIELRNAEEKPLLVFIPPGARTSANDSLDISTFIEVPLPQLQEKIRARVIEKLRLLAPTTPGKAQTILQQIRGQDKAGRFLNLESEIRYYIALETNGGTEASLGGALYTLGLLPDYELTINPGRIASRIDLNIQTVETIVDPRESLMVRLQNLKLQVNTAQKDFYELLSKLPPADSRTWAKQIATSSGWSHLAYNRLAWVEDATQEGNIKLYFTKHSDLPLEKDDGNEMPVLKLNVKPELHVYWITNPPPVQCNNLDHFRIEFVGDQGAVIEYPGIIKKPGGRSKYCSKKLSKLDKLGLEEGAYFIRIRAYNSSNQIINDEDERSAGSEQKINESGQIWITTTEAPPLGPSPLRNQLVPSYLHAWFEASLSRYLNPATDEPLTLREYKWGTGLKTSAGNEGLFTIRFDERNLFSVPFSQILMRAEQQTLANPAELGRWQVDLTRLRSGGEVELRRKARQSGESEAVPAAFLQARQKLFEAIRTARGISLSNDEKTGPTAPDPNQVYLCGLVDLTNYAEEIIEYAGAYNAWLQEIRSTLQQDSTQSLQQLRGNVGFLELDVLEVDIPIGLSDTTKALLLGPTHPVRLLWHLQFSQMIKAWLQRGTAYNKEMARRLLNDTTRQLLVGGLLPNNLPPVMLYRDWGKTQLLVDRGALGFYWQLFLPVETTDTQSVRARLEQLLGLTGSRQLAAEVSKAELSRKLLRYLYQHPYVDTLKINVFNPGDASLLAGCLLELQKHYRDLKYQLRLFAEQTEGVEFGEAIDELINPQRQVSDEQDEFGTASLNPLFPKLRFSRNRVTDYNRNPEAFEAHITIFLNFYPVNVGLTTGEGSQRSSYVYGLVQDLEQVFNEDSGGLRWQQQLKPTVCPDLPSGDGSLPAMIGGFFNNMVKWVAGKSSIPEIIANLLNNLQELQGIYAEGKTRSDQAIVPVVELDLSQSDRHLLYLAHRNSDWVITVDRNIGSEYFDGFLPQINLNSDQPVYLLDHSPEYISSSGEKLFLTTRFNTEILRLLQPAITTFGLPAGNDYEEIYLRTLRSLSGKLVLKLLSAYNQREEIVSLILAQLFLKEYGLLQNRFVIPLDAHSELFSQAAKEDWLEKEISLKRTDLLLIEANPAKRSLHFRLVEIKARQAVSLGTLVDLSSHIAEQLANSREVLRRHFDPTFSEPDRLDRPFKTRDLTKLLDFYLARSVRHKLTEATHAEEVRKFILSLDQGYTMDFEGVSLLFDFSAEGVTHHTDTSVVVHQIGQDYVHKLIEAERQTAASNRSVETENNLLPVSPMRDDSSFEDIIAYFKPNTSKHLPGILEGQRKRERSTPTPTSTAPQPQPAKQGQEDNLTLDQLSPSVADVAEAPAATETPLVAPVEVAAKVDVGVVVASSEPTPATEEAEAGPRYDVLLGDTHDSPQYGIFGKAAGRTVALDLNGCNTISLFGVQGGGKSYTLGTIVEMATKPLPSLNQLPSPLATVIFHYNESQDYAPEFVTMVKPNSQPTEIERLAQEYKATPASLDDVLLLTTPDKLNERRADFPSITVEPIYFHSSELSLKDWRFLMSAVSNQAMYLQQMTYIMRQYRADLTLDNLKKGIEEADLSNTQRKLALMRLQFAGQFINDRYRLAEKLKPGRLIIVDVRDELMEQDEALGLFVVMLNVFANAGRDFNKLVVFDEAHKYMSNRDLTGHIVEVVRQMRHQGVSILIASQDPESLPEQIIELSSIMVLHRFNSPGWIKHIQKSVAALSDLTANQLAALATGEAYIWANKTTDNSFSTRAVKVRCRPRFTMHGGSTKTALSK